MDNTYAWEYVHVGRLVWPAHAMGAGVSAVIGLIMTLEENTDQKVETVVSDLTTSSLGSQFRRYIIQLIIFVFLWSPLWENAHPTDERHACSRGNLLANTQTKYPS